MYQELDAIFDPATFETIWQSPVAYITSAQFRIDGSSAHTEAPGQVVAIKSASTLPEFSREPHDIVKELRLLSRISHVNVIEVLGHTYDHTSSLHYWMPYISRTLDELLDRPSFSPHRLLGSEGDETMALHFTILAKSLIFQLISAIAYLHDPAQGIAHRDIKPRNVLLTDEGCVKLIDFGIAWKQSLSSAPDVLWPEPPGNLCFEVGSGPYRPPELIFGPNDYDPFALDLWSLGATCAEFFTPLRAVQDDSEEDSDSEPEEDDNAKKEPFILPRTFSKIARVKWNRDSLFNAQKGTIGLAWSIFKVRGTPTDENWPEFTALPHAEKISFQVVPPVDLRVCLPNLPTSSCRISTTKISHFPPDTMDPSPLDLVHRFLVYPSGKRLHAADALYHPWFSESADGPLLLPRGYSPRVIDSAVTDWEGKHLRDILLTHFGFGNGGST